MKFYNVDTLAELFELSPLTIRKWLRSGKLKGRKSGKEWKVTDEDLKEMFCETDFYSVFTFLDKETGEERKPVIDVYGKNKLFKELYPEAYEQAEQNNNQYTEWDFFEDKCEEKLETRFPYPFKPDEIAYWNDDKTGYYMGNEPEAKSIFYFLKQKEEEDKLDKLLDILKVKYHVEDDYIDEIKRTSENVFLLSFGKARYDI